MNILYASSALSRYKAAGGVASHVDLLSAYAHRTGHNTFMLIPQPPEAGMAERRNNIRFIRPQLEDFIPFRHHMNTLREYRDVRKEFLPDVVHLHSMTGLSIAVSETRVPVVSTIHALNRPHEDSVNHSFLSRLGTIFRNFENAFNAYQLTCLCRYSDKVIFVSRNTRDDALRYCRSLDLDSAEVLAPGIDLTRFRNGSMPDARERLGYGHSFIILFVGRMVEEKGPQDILRAIPPLVSEIPRVKALFIGEGPGVDTCRREAVSLGIQDRAVFIGGIPNRDLPDYYNAADVYINPTSVEETFGISTGEAMACGTPVVISARGASTGIATAEVSVIFDDPRELSEKILQLYRDPARRRELSLAGRRHVSGYSFEGTGSRMMDIYEHLSTRSGRGRNGAPGTMRRFFAINILATVFHRLKSAYRTVTTISSR